MRKGAKTRPKQRLYIALEQLDFAWYEENVEIVKEMWEKDKPIDEIAEEVDRDGDEVFVLLLDLMRNRKIKKRDNGIFGRRDSS